MEEIGLEPLPLILSSPPHLFPTSSQLLHAQFSLAAEYVEDQGIYFKVGNLRVA